MKNTVHIPRFVSAIIALLLPTCILVAQQKNDLLDRSFWKEKPTLALVKEKIAQGHSPIDFDANQFDATTLAINSNAPKEIILYLMGIKENHPNKITHDGRTYLFWAAWKGNIEVMDYLIKNKTSISHLDEKGYSVLTFAASTGQKDPKIYDYLQKKGLDIASAITKEGANVLLLVSPFLTSIKETNYFVNKGLSLQSTDYLGYNIFAYASRHGNKDFLNELIQAGIDPRAVAKDGGNAFMMATRPTRYHTNTLDFYHYMAKLGIPINTQTQSGENPLHNLARSGDLYIFTFFMEQGVDVNQANAQGTTPIMLAARGQKNLDNFAMMFDKIQKINHQNKHGQSALTYALMNQSDVAVKIALLLIGGGASQGLKDADGNTLSYYLISHYKNAQDYAEKLRMLYTFGFANNAIQANGNSLYHVAVHFRNKEVIEQLAKDPSIAINTINNDGLSALHLAASSDSDGSMLRLLIELGADKSIRTEFGESAYELAQENELLRKNGVDISFLQ